MQEIWKDVVGYEGLYKISNLGNIISARRNYNKGCKYLTPFENDGYDRVTLVVNYKRKNYLVHRLVAEAFIPNVEQKEVVNHIDGNKKNNTVDNLEWVTKQENTFHAINTGVLTVQSVYACTHVYKDTLPKHNLHSAYLTECTPVSSIQRIPFPSQTRLPYILPGQRNLLFSYP